MLTKRQFVCFTAAVGLALTFPVTAQPTASDYPNKPVRLIVAFPPGGGADIMARTISQGLAESLKQPFVVENRPGASGIVAAQAVLSAPQDGYTLLVGGSGPMVFTPITQKLPYDPHKDFTAVTILGSYANVIAVRNDLKAQTIEELVAMAKESPGKITYGHPGMTFQVPMEAFLDDAGISMLSVPYKGGSPLAADLMGGSVDVAISDISTFANLHKAGKVRILAVTTFNRPSLLPDVPTLKESGYLSNFEVSSFTALGAPSAVPATIINKLQTEVAKILHTPEVKAQLAERSIEPGGISPAETLARYQHEIKVYTPIAEKVGLVQK